MSQFSKCSLADNQFLLTRVCGFAEDRGVSFRWTVSPLHFLVRKNRGKVMRLWWYGSTWLQTRLLFDRVEAQCSASIVTSYINYTATILQAEYSRWYRRICSSYSLATLQSALSSWTINPAYNPCWCKMADDENMHMKIKVRAELIPQDCAPKGSEMAAANALHEASIPWQITRILRHFVVA